MFLWCFYTVQLNGILKNPYFSSMYIKTCWPLFFVGALFLKKKKRSLTNVFSNVGYFRREDATPLEVVLWRGRDRCHLQAVTIMINKLWHNILSGQGVVFGGVVMKAQRTLHDSQCFNHLISYNEGPESQYLVLSWRIGYSFPKNKPIVCWMCVVVFEKHPQISWLVVFPSKSYQMQRCRPFEWTPRFFFYIVVFVWRK